MDNNKFLSKVYMWMFAGVLVSFITAYVVSINPNMLEAIFAGSGFIVCVVVELAVALIFSFMIKKLNPTAAKILFLVYSFVTGLTFSSIFIVYELQSILIIFGLTTMLFLILSIMGNNSKRDLTKIGNILMIGLVMIIIGTVINMFLGNSTLDLILTIVGLGLFIGLTAYDTQKILALRNSSVISEENLAIYGAFELYLDFINLFLRLIELFGKHND